jgi:hypothetical protein
MQNVERSAPCLDISAAPAAANRQILVSEKIHENAEGFAASNSGNLLAEFVRKVLVDSSKIGKPKCNIGAQVHFVKHGLSPRLSSLGVWNYNRSV